MHRKYAAVAVVAGSMLAGGAIGVAVFAPHLANAASNPSIPAVTVSGSQTSSGAGSGTFHSNEDPAHEANESPEREAAENSGKAFGHGGWGGHHGFNEDPAHEANESPEREAQEDQENRGGAGQTTPPAADSAPAQAS